MAYNDNKDILSWKRLIDAIQVNDKLRVVKESLKEGGVHKLRVDQQTHITAEHHDVVVSSNDMGIIVDIYDKKSDNIDTNTYWNDDVMESKKIKEGTWSVPETPEQVKKLTNLLKNPLDAETALDELYDVFGDDELFDDLEVMKREEPETDVRHVVIRRLKDMNFIKEVRENSWPADQDIPMGIRPVPKEFQGSGIDWGDAGGHKRAYKVIHVDKGSMDVVATTTIEAARLFAKTKGLKSTKGIDVHLYPLEEDKVFKVKNIEWDTEDSTGEGPEELDLPKSLSVNVPKAHLGSYEDTEEFISDFISNVTGFTHKGYRTDPEITESLASTTDDLSTLEDLVMSYWDSLPDKMQGELNKFWDEPRDTDEIKPFDESSDKLHEEDIKWSDFVKLSKSSGQGGMDWNNFIDYVEKFYGTDGIYADFFKNHDGSEGVTKKEILKHVKILAKDKTWQWGQGDTMDREKIRDMMLNARPTSRTTYRGMREGEDGAKAEDLVDIITHRIKQDNNLMLKLLGDEGPDSLMNAIENVADFYSGTTEVGSSDVSAMVDAVKKQLI